MSTVCIRFGMFKHYICSRTFSIILINNINAPSSQYLNCFIFKSNLILSHNLLVSFYCNGLKLRTSNKYQFYQIDKQSRFPLSIAAKLNFVNIYLFLQIQNGDNENIAARQQTFMICLENDIIQHIILLYTFFDLKSISQSSFSGIFL